MDKVYRKRQLAFSIVLLLGELTGIRSVIYMLSFIGNYKDLSDASAFEMGASVGLNYMLFSVLITISFILSIRAKAAVKHMEYLSRNIDMVIAVIITSSSSVAVLIVIMLGYARYMGDMDMLARIYESEEVKLLISNPQEFYIYMIAVAIILPLAIKSIFDIINYFRTRKIED